MTKVRPRATNGQLALKEDEWFVPDLARAVGIRPHVIFGWIRKGKLIARQVDGPQRRWSVHTDAATLANLKAAPTEVGTQGSKRV